MSSSTAEAGPLVIVRRAIIDLIPDAANMRTHSEANIQAIRASLARWGQQKPIVIDGKGVIRCGNGTVEAAKKLGWTHIDCVVSELDGAELAAFAIADNRTAELAGWSEEISGVLEKLGAELPDFPMDDLALRGFLPEGQSNEPLIVIPDPEKTDSGALRAKWGVEKGQKWQLGRHFLACGDCTDQDFVRRVIGDAKVAAVVTDPPYGISYKYDKHDDNEPGWYDLMKKVVPMMKSMAPFVVMPSCQIKRMKWWYDNFPPDWIVCWYKGSTGHNSLVGFNDWEPHLVWGKPPSQMHDYFQTRCGFDVDGHPCPKPIEYAEWLVERAAEEGGVVFDPFSGSGTTLLACQITGRSGIGIELSENYVAVSLERFFSVTQMLPVLVNDKTA